MIIARKQDEQAVIIQKLDAAVEELNRRTGGAS